MPSSAVNIALRGKQDILSKRMGCISGGSIIRKLRTAYFGSAFRIRRDRDNVELDIGFAGKNTDLATVLSHTIQTKTIVNLLGTDGNFTTDTDVDGLGDGWVATDATVSMASNEQTFTATATSGNIKYNKTGLTSGHKLYACCYVKATAAASKIQLIGIDGTPYHSGGGSYEFLSGTTTLGVTYNELKIRDLRTSAWTDVNVKLVHMFDLTAIFGSGNEPSKIEMDSFMRTHAYLESESGTVGNAYVTIIYDQIDGYSLVQTTAANQPAIVLSGALVTSPSGVAELLPDASNDALFGVLPVSTTLNVSFGSWSDCQGYEIITQSSGSTYFPAGSSGLQLPAMSEFAYFTGPVPTKYLNGLKAICMSDLHADDLFRLRFYTAGAKTLSVTESGSGITFIDKSGTQNTSYSRTVNAFDWVVVRATTPSGITYIGFSSKDLSGCLYSIGFNNMSNIQNFYITQDKFTGKIPNINLNTALKEISVNSNAFTGRLPDIRLNTNLTLWQSSTNKTFGSIQDLTYNTALVSYFAVVDNLTSFSGGTCSNTLGTFRVDDNLLTQSAVDAILAAFVAAGRASGTRVLNLGGTGNATPSAAGLADKATLVSRGWTVTTN